MADELIRSHLAKVALAAWVNVPVDQLPQDKMWIEHPCDLNRQAWDRVVSAVLAATRAQGPRSVAPCYECGTDNLIGPICGGCNPEIAAMVEGGSGPGEAVAREAAFVEGYKAAWSGRGDHTAPRREYIAKLAADAWNALAATPPREG